MIPKKIKVEATINIENADRDCSKEEIEEWFKSIVKTALKNNFATFQKSSKNTIEDINAIVLDQA